MTVSSKGAENRDSADCAVACRQALIDYMADEDTEVNVSAIPPLFDLGYEPLNLRCPHGVLWFMEPTAEQRLRYAREKIL